MKLSLPSRLLREALADAPSGDYIDKLLEKMNADAEQTNQALTQNLTFADNMNAAIVKYDLTHGSEKKIPNPLKTRPAGVYAIRSAAINGGTRYAINSFDWRFVDGTDPKATQQIGITVGYELNHTAQSLEVARTSVQSIPNNVGTLAQWSGVVTPSTLGSAISWASGSNTRVTVSEAGLYLVSATASYAVNATGPRTATVKVNNTIRWASEIAATASYYTQVTVSGQSILAAGDYIELVVAQGSGGALDLNGFGSLTSATADNRTHMAVTRLFNSSTPQNEVTLLIIGG